MDLRSMNISEEDNPSLVDLKMSIDSFILNNEMTEGYAEISSKHLDLIVELEQTLNESQRKIALAIDEVEGDLLNTTQNEWFIAGFKTATKLLLETMR